MLRIILQIYAEKQRLLTSMGICGVDAQHRNDLTELPCFLHTVPESRSVMSTLNDAPNGPGTGDSAIVL